MKGRLLIALGCAITTGAAAQSAERDFRDEITHWSQQYVNDPNNAAVNLELGVCYLHTECSSEAIQHLSVASRSGVGLSELDLMLGVAYHQAADYKKAMYHYNKYLNGLSESARKSKEVPADVAVLLLGESQGQHGEIMVVKNIDSHVYSLMDQCTRGVCTVLK